MTTDPRVACEKVLVLATEQKVRFPKTLTDAQIKQAIGAQLMISRDDEGNFILQTAGNFHILLYFYESVTNYIYLVDNLIEKYGQEIPQKSENSKRSIEVDSEDEDENENSTDGSKKKRSKVQKPKKSETYANEENKEIADAIREMAGIYYKNADPRKGGVFSKAAKAIRECETKILNKKDAMALKGVGKGIAAYIEEFLETGVILKLEELRAGIA